jgi:hypothetical protein
LLDLVVRKTTPATSPSSTIAATTSTGRVAHVGRRMIVHHAGHG